MLELLVSRQWQTLELCLIVHAVEITHSKTAEGGEPGRCAFLDTAYINSAEQMLPLLRTIVPTILHSRSSWPLSVGVGYLRAPPDRLFYRLLLLEHKWQSLV